MESIFYFISYPEHVFLGFISITDLHQISLQAGSQMGFGHGETHGVITFHQSHGEPPRYQLVSVLCEDVLPALHSLDVLGMCGVSTNSVFVHQSYEISLSQQSRGFSRAVNYFNVCRLELSDLTVVENLFVRPLVVDVDLQVIPLLYGKTAGRKPLAIDVDADCRLGPQGVPGDAGQEVADDELVDPGLAPLQVTGRLDGVDGRMGLV